MVNKFLTQHYTVTVSLRYPNTHLEILTSIANYLSSIQLPSLQSTCTVLLLDSLPAASLFTQTYLRVNEIRVIPYINAKGLLSWQKM